MEKNVTEKFCKIIKSQAHCRSKIK